MISLYLPSTPLNFFLSVVVADYRKFQYGEGAVMVMIDQLKGHSNENRYLTLLDRLLHDNPFQQSYILPSDSGLRGKMVTRQENFAFLQKLISKCSFDKVFVGNDRRIEFQYCLYQIKKHGGDVQGIYLDDGLYSYVNIARRKKEIFDYLEFVLKKIRYPWFMYVKQVGASNLVHSVYAVLPQLLRSAFKQKNILTVMPEWFTTEKIKKLCVLGCDLFGCDVERLSHAEVLINLVHPDNMILMKNYENALRLKINHCLGMGKNVIVKYHPRESEFDRLGLQKLGNIYILPHRIALEFALPLLPKRCQVISGLSTLPITTKMLRPDLSQLVTLQQPKDEDDFYEFIKKLQLKIDIW